MNKVPDHYFEEPTASKLERTRADRRGRRRLIYDCGRARVTLDHTVVCSRGVRFRTSGDGSIKLLPVLRGMTPSECQKCKRYAEA